RAPRPDEADPLPGHPPRWSFLGVLPGDAGRSGLLAARRRAGAAAAGVLPAREGVLRDRIRGVEPAGLDAYPAGSHLAHPRGARGGAAMRELSAGAREIIALSARLSPWIPAGACARASRWLDPSTGMSGAWCSHEPQTPVSCAGLTRASMVSRHKAHSYSRHCGAGSWIAGSSPAMTTERQCVQFHSAHSRASGDPVQAVTTREIIRWIPELSRPHGEERRAAA